MKAFEKAKGKSRPFLTINNASYTESIEPDHIDFQEGGEVVSYGFIRQSIFLFLGGVQ
jgi:hypothetical protein